MTVQNSANKTVPANGDGVNKDFGYTIKLINSTATAANDLDVFIIDAAGDLTLQTIITDYTQTYNDSTESGTVTFITAPTSTPFEQVFMIRERVLTQPFEIPVNSDFDAEKIETMSDNMAIQISDLNENIDRSLKLPATFTGTFQATQDPVDDNLLVFSGTTGTMVNSTTTLTTIVAGATNAAASATAAATSATNAATSETNAASSATASASSATDAANSAAGVNLPSITVTDTGSILQVKADGTAYELLTAGTDGEFLRSNGPDTALSYETVGKALQTKQTFLNSGTNSTTSATAADITNLAATITPRDTSSKILVEVSFFSDINGATNLTTGDYQILRGASTEIAAARLLTEIDDIGTMITMDKLDNPATASAVTYKVQFARKNGDGTVRANFGTFGSNGTATITLTEIGA